MEREGDGKLCRLIDKEKFIKSNVYALFVSHVQRLQTTHTQAHTHTDVQ